MSKYLGGAAFPYSFKDGDDDHIGMSLRDYFAAAFLQGTAARNIVGSPKERAETAYAMADAMLAERSKQ